jgi:hypothetical protein
MRYLFNLTKDLKGDSVMETTRGKFSIVKQVCELIPPHLVSTLARKHGVSKKSRTFSPWSHVVSLVYAQLAHAMSLNDVCDALRIHRTPLASIRGATPPSRNTLSHANRVRDAKMAQELFWRVLEHLQTICPTFAGKNYKGFPRRFKRAIHVVDSTTIKLVVNCVDWARHKRSKAGSKVHMRLDLQSFLPQFVIIDTARPNDNKVAREMCAGIKKSEIVIFDKAYLDFGHLFSLKERGVFWVTRAKINLQAHCIASLPAEPKGTIVRDEIIELTRYTAHKKYPEQLRRITALVEVKGTIKEMTFLTNNLDWAPGTIAELYKSRWGIEAFFKQLKQTLQLCDFLGHSKNAIQWQIWIALLTYVLLRYLAFISRWNHSFNRIVTLIRSSLWSRFKLLPLLKSYGTADGSFRLLATPEQAYLLGFAPP